MAILDDVLKTHSNSSALLSHVLHKMTNSQPWALLTAERVENIVKNGELPGPSEQLDNLIFWLGKNQSSLACGVKVTKATEAAIGSVDGAECCFIVEYAISKGLVAGGIDKPYPGAYVYFENPCLTFDGWGYLAQLKRGKSSSRVAIMAMKFGDETLDAVVRDYFKPAVAAAGFDLKRIDESQPAGLIDDQMRVEIRQSKFLISDLTHGSNGAYWEAGYAEGLGKPVIYTCQKDVCNATGTHFDTNHHLTVEWSTNCLKEAVEKLKSTIRATFPDEAKLAD